MSDELKLYRHSITGGRFSIVAVWIGVLIGGFGCDSEIPKPDLKQVNPERIDEGTMVKIDIIGSGFLNRYSRALNSSGWGFEADADFRVFVVRAGDPSGIRTTLSSVDYIDDEHLSADLPADLLPGWYRLTVETPFHKTDDLENAFEVIADVGDQDTAESDPYDTSALLEECGSRYADALLCTGFEDGIRYPSWAGHGIIETTSEQKFTGEASLHAVLYEQGDVCHMLGAFSPVFSGDIYFRFYIWVKEGTLTGLIKVFGLRGIGVDENDPIMSVDVDLLQDKSVRLFFHETGNEYRSEPSVFSEGEWVCISGRVTVDDAEGSAEVSINGREAVLAEGENTTSVHGISTADVGVVWIEGGQTSAEVYVDNFVVDDALIHCR